MSYCRWSSDDFQCDIYCYESVHGGYVTDIASNRPVLPDDMPPQVAFDQDNLTAYIDRHAAVMRILDTAERRPIGLPLDGESFTDDTPAEAAERLQGLKDMGYNVPQYAIDELREEAGGEG